MQLAVVVSPKVGQPRMCFKVRCGCGKELALNPIRGMLIVCTVCKRAETLGKLYNNRGTNSVRKLEFKYARPARAPKRAK